MERKMLVLKIEGKKIYHCSSPVGLWCRGKVAKISMWFKSCWTSTYKVIAFGVQRPGQRLNYTCILLMSTVRYSYPSILPMFAKVRGSQRLHWTCWTGHSVFTGWHYKTSKFDWLGCFASIRLTGNGHSMTAYFWK